MTDEVWKGEADNPQELADEIEAMASQVVSLPYVEPLEVVTVQMSWENRSLVVRALRAFSETKH